MLNAILVMLALDIVLSVVGWIFGGIPMLLAFGFASILIDAILYLASPSIVLRVLKAKPLSNPDLESMVENLALDCHMKVPKIMMMDSHIPNVACVGRSKTKSYVVVTRGLMELERGEIRAMIGHSMGLIRNRNVFPNTLAAALGMIFSWPANRGYWALFSINDSRKGNLFWMVPILIFGPIGGFFAKMAAETGMSKRADYTSVMLKNDPREMASALRKASAIAREKPAVGPVYTLNLFVFSPFKRDWFTNLFDSHSYLERRIEILEGLRLGYE